MTRSSRRSPLAWIAVALVAVVAGLWSALGGIEGASATNGGHFAAESASGSVEAGATDDTTSAAHAPDAITAPAIHPSRAGSASAIPRTGPWTGGVITGRVLGGPGASEPIAHIAVRATSPRSTVPVPERRTTTDAEGRYELRDLVAVPWEVEASLDALDLRGAASVVLDEETMPRAELDVLLPYARHVEVHLVDVRGDPIGSLSLGIDPALMPLVCVAVASACRDVGEVLSPADMATNRIRDESPKGTRTRFDVEILGAGAQCLHALLGERVIATRALRREDQRVEIVVDAASVARFLGPCAVQVVGAEGTPIAGATAAIRLPGVELVHPVDADGVARFEGLPFGDRRISVDATGFVGLTAVVAVPRESPQKVVLSAARRISGRITIEGGRDPSSTVPGLWRVEDPGAKLGDPKLRLTRKRPVAAEFAFEGLEPGTYVVAAAPGSVALLSADDVRRGKASGAAWVDLTRADARDVSLEVPAWLVDP